MCLYWTECSTCLVSSQRVELLLCFIIVTMGNKDEKSVSERSMDYAIAGAISGFVTRFLCQPLDVVKIRFQLQVEPIKSQHVSKYQSVIQGFGLIIKEEGFVALWKGHVPAQLLSITYGVGQFYSYGTIMSFSKRHDLFDKQKYATQFVAGAFAGGIGTIISYPFDTIRTRLVAQSTNHEVYKGILHSCRLIVQHESPKVFFAGLIPTLLQVVPHAAIQFTFYGIFTDIYKKYSQEANTNFSNSMLAGSAAGLMAKTAVYPFDLAKKRLQIQGFEHGRKGFGKFFKCYGLLNCVIVTVKDEGFKGLFKGIVPSQLKAAITSALYFTSYEQALLLLKAVY